MTAPGAGTGRVADAPVPAPAAPATAESAGETPDATASGAVAAPAPAAGPAAVAVATPSPPAGPSGGEPEPTAPPSGTPPWRARRHRRLDRPTAGRQAAPAAALDELAVTRVSYGLLLGRGQAGEPVSLPLFRPRPVRVVLAGGAWAADLLAFRALRYGVRAVVFTESPAGWVDLGRRATGRTDRVAVLLPGEAATMTGSADSPVLRVAAAGTAHHDQRLPPWTTELLVAPEVVPRLAVLLAGAEVVLAQRLDPAAAGALAAARDLRDEDAERLRLLHDDMLAVITATGVRYAWLHPTEAERAALG